MVTSTVEEDQLIMGAEWVISPVTCAALVVVGLVIGTEEQESIMTAEMSLRTRT